MKNRISLLMLLSFFALAAVSVLSGVYIYANPDTRRLGIILTGASAVFSVVFIIQLLFYYKNRLRFVAKMSKEISITQRETLYDFPAPAFIIDENHVIVWINSRFDKEVFEEKEAFGINLDELMDINFDKLFSKKGTLVTYKDKYYRAMATRPDENHSNLTMIYFKDETDYIMLDYEHKQSHPSVMIISIDNYDDLLENAKESEKAHITVEIETLIENFIDGTTGVTKKMSSSKFFIILEERHLRKIIDERFKILDKARNITVGERQSITLSIGVGHGAANLAESEVFARQALDMCLGRGGDQAAVKTSTGFEFFGGVSKGVEKRTKVKTRIIANAVRELVAPSDTIFIMGHQMGDLDSIGSATGLCALLKNMGKKAYVVVDPDNNLADVLIDHINSSESDTFFIPPELAVSMKTDSSTLFIVDTHNPERLDSKELYEMFDKVIVIDHHRKMVKYIENSLIFYHEPYASSASEMVAELIQYFGDDVRISAPVAECLLAGIMLDTKNFVMRTGVRTFEAAAYLRKMGADTVTVKSLFSTSFAMYKKKYEIINSSFIHKECAIAIAGGDDPDVLHIAAPQAADELLNISGVNASFVLYDDGGKAVISARSLGGINVQVIMEMLGGGGHQTMAGAQLDNVSLDTAAKKIESAIDEYISLNKN